MPEKLRGTYAGLGSQEVVDYIKSLGVTSVELLPVHTFINDSNLLEKGLTNYWGYNTIGFFAPDPRYASDVPNSLREFKEMVARFHDAGLEVILDVVYNHTAEGNELGPTLSFKGIDNASYYRLLPDKKRYYINDTGTGNTVNCRHPRVIQMVTDSLRYWAEQMHVDGFRFDLGTILAREAYGFDEQSGFLKAVRPGSRAGTRQIDRRAVGLRPRRLSGRRLPAGLGGMERQVSRHRARFLARRSAAAGAGAAALRVRRHLRPRGPARLGQRQFHHRPRRLHAERLGSYNEKHNEANGEDNSDGSSDNRSWNCGAEGPTDDPAINALRERQMRNMLATLLLSQGTPMLLGGRRIRPHAARQQQRLLPGQRDQLVRLGHRAEADQALLAFTKR